MTKTRERSKAFEALLTQALETARRAAAEGDLAESIRHLDRAHRDVPDNTMIAHALAQALARAGEHRQAVAVLAPSAPLVGDPEREALLISSLCQIGAIEEGAQRCAAALSKYALVPGGALARAAQALALTMPSSPAGWFGVSPKLELIGEIAAAKGIPPLELHLEGASADIKAVYERRRDKAFFRMRLPRGASRHVVLTAAGKALIGSGLTFPPDFLLDGRIGGNESVLEGWARIGWMPRFEPAIEIADGSGTAVLAATRPDPTDPTRHLFSLQPATQNLRGPRFTVSALMPDSSKAEFPDSPFLLRDAVLLRKTPAPARRKSRKKRPARAVDIVVPVYSGLTETLSCIDALRATAPDAHIVVIDDASPESELSAALDALSDQKRITLLRNTKNLGFAASVNRGFTNNPDRDVVIVNADAIVHGNWLERLRTAAYSADDIATATPFSNDGSIVSYPADPAELPDIADAQLDSLCARVHRGVRVDLPVGVGFCLYMRRDGLDETGAFDVATFGKGYGEETDFCLRAAKLGWRHVLAADVFVTHVGGRSFGARKDALLARSGRILNIRYPGYDKRIAAFLARDPIETLRRGMDAARLVASKWRIVLLTTHALPGGVDRVVRERSQALREQGLLPLVIRPIEDAEPDIRIDSDDLDLRHLRYRIPSERVELAKLLRSLSVDHIEIHHILGHDAGLIEMLRSLPATQGVRGRAGRGSVPYDLYVHDYVWFCPRVTLIGSSGRYCGEPDIAGCNVCIRRNGSLLGEKITVARLRERSAAWLGDARRVVAPSRDAAVRLRRHFPKTEIAVEPLENLPRPEKRGPMPQGRVRIAAIGAINRPKGYEVLLACARDAARRDLPLEFVVIGYSEDDSRLAETGRVFVTGLYRDEEVPALISRERVNAAFFPTVWPETWCYTLSHALRAGLPTLGFALGAVGERLKGLGTLVPPDISPSDLNDLLLNMGRRTWHDARAGNRAERKTAPGRRTRESQPGEWNDFTMKTAAAESEKGESGLSVSAQVFTLPRGIYRCSVKSAAPVKMGKSGELILPAVQITAGPGMTAGEVELALGAANRGSWLCQVGDMTLARVNTEEASFVLTSMRGPGQQPLDISVEKLPTAPELEQKPLGESQPEPLPDSLRTQIVAHIRNRGDVSFLDQPWAGRVESGLCIEAFAITPLEEVPPGEIEYKALTASGFETPWQSGGTFCGTRGRSLPLLGFAVRVKPGRFAEQFDCEYSGYFRSGKITGPLPSSTPCRSDTLNDPLEGLQFRLFRREASAKPAPAAAKSQDRSRKAPARPRFGRFREDETETVELPATSQQEPAQPKRGAQAVQRRANAANKKKR